MVEKIKKPFPSALDILSIIGLFMVLNFMGELTLAMIQKYLTQSVGLAWFLCYSFTFLVVIFYALYLKRVRAKDEKLFNFSMRFVSPGIILWGLILTLAVSILIEPLIALFPEHYFDVLNKLLLGGGWSLLTTIVAAPVLEEMLFRGILQSSLSYRFGRWISLLVVSLVFALVHGIPPQAVNAFFISLILGYFFIRTGSLLCVIIIHMLNNAIAYFTMLLNGEKYISMRELVGNDYIFKFVYLACIFVFLVAVINVIRIFRLQKNNNKVK